MPYISPERRKNFDPHIEKLQESLKELGLTKGDLNYTITRLVAFYFLEEKRYSSINKVIGVLECVKAEFYRRIGKPYEDKMIPRNGDVPEFQKVFMD